MPGAGLNPVVLLAIDNAVGDDLTPAEKYGAHQAAGGQLLPAVANAQTAAGYSNASLLKDKLEASTTADQQKWWASATPIERDMLTSVQYKTPLAKAQEAHGGGIFGDITGIGRDLVSGAEGAGKDVRNWSKNIAGAVTGIPSALSGGYEGPSGGGMQGTASIGAGTLGGLGTVLHVAGRGVSDIANKIPFPNSLNQAVGGVVNAGQGEIGRVQRTVGIMAMPPASHPDLGFQHLFDFHQWGQAYDEAADAHYINPAVVSHVNQLFGGDALIMKIAKQINAGVSVATIFQSLADVGKQEQLAPAGPNGPQTYSTGQTTLQFLLTSGPQGGMNPIFAQGMAELNAGQADLGRVVAAPMLFNFNGKGQVTGTNDNPVQDGWQNLVHAMLSGVIDGGVDWYTNPWIIAGQAKDISLIGKYLIQDGQTMRQAAMLEPAVMRWVDEIAEAMKPDQLGLLKKENDLMAVQTLISADVEPDSGAVLDYLSSGAGEHAILNGRAAYYYKNKLLWPHITALSSVAEGAKYKVVNWLDNMANDTSKTIDLYDEAGNIKTPTDLAKEAGEIPTDITAQEAAGSTAEEAELQKTWKGNFARLSNKVTHMNIEHGFVDLSADNAILTVTRFTHLYLPPAMADQVDEAFVRALTISDKRLIMQAAVKETVDNLGILETPEGQQFLDDYISTLNGRQSYDPDGRDIMDDGGHSALREAQLSDKIPLPDAKKMMELSAKNLVMRGANAGLNAEWMDGFMQGFWKPAMLFRPGFGFRIAGEEVLGAIFRDGMTNLLKSRYAGSLTGRYYQALEEGDTRFVAAFDAMSAGIPDNDMEALTKRAHENFGTKDPTLTTDSRFGTTWKDWLHRVFLHRTINYALLTGAKFGPEDLRSLTATVLRLVSDPDQRLLLGGRDELMGLENMGGEDIRDSTLVGASRGKANSRATEFRLSGPAKEISYPETEGQAGNLMNPDRYKERAARNQQYHYFINGFKQSPLSRVIIRSLNTGATEDEAADAGAKFILDDYNGANKWVGRFDRSKSVPGIGLVGVDATPEQMAQDWADREMLAIKGAFTNGDGDAIKLGDDWNPASKSIQIKKAKLVPGNKLPVMKNAGLTVIDMVDHGELPNIDELMTIPAEDLPPKVIARESVLSARSLVDGVRSRGMYQFVGRPLHYLSREPLWILHNDQAYKLAMARLATKVGADDDVLQLTRYDRGARLPSPNHELGAYYNAGHHFDWGGMFGEQKTTKMIRIPEKTLRLTPTSYIDSGGSTLIQSAGTEALRKLNMAEFRRIDAMTETEADQEMVRLGLNGGDWGSKAYLANRAGATAAREAGYDAVLVKANPHDVSELDEYLALSPKALVEDKAEGLTLEARSRIANDLAKERADREIMPYIHNPRLRSQMSIAARNISPFWFAQEQQMKRWARTLYMAPEAVAKVELTVRGLQDLGFLYTDPQTGQLTFNYPGVGFLGRFAQEVLDRGKGVIPLNMNLTGQLTAMIPGINRFGTPSVGPLVSLPLDVITGLDPKFSQWNTDIQGPSGTNETAWEQLVPTLVPRIMEAFSGHDTPDQSAGFLNAAMQVAAGLTAEGKGYKPGMTVVEQQDLNIRIERYTVQWLLVRAILGFGLPASPEIDELDSLGLDGKYTDFVNSGMTYNQALAAYALMYPTGLAYTVGHTSSTSGAYLPEVNGVLDWMEANKGVLNDHPYAAPWLLPSKLTTGQFSDATYQYELAQGMKTRVSLQQWSTNVIFRMLANKYYDTENYAYANNLMPQFDKWAANFKANYPIFNQYLLSDTGHATRQKVISDMNTLLNSPECPDTPTVREIGQVMYEYNKWLADMTANPKSQYGNGQIRWSLVQSFLAWGTAYAKAHPDVLSYWSGVISYEVNTSAG
jgi:hypothetical protein